MAGSNGKAQAIDGPIREKKKKNTQFQKSAGKATQLDWTSLTDRLPRQASAALRLRSMDGSRRGASVWFRPGRLIYGTSQRSRPTVLLKAARFLAALPPFSASELCRPQLLLSYKYLTSACLRPSTVAKKSPLKLLWQAQFNSILSPSRRHPLAGRSCQQRSSPHRDATAEVSSSSQHLEVCLELCRLGSR